MIVLLEVPFIHADILLQKRFSNKASLTNYIHKYIFEFKYIIWLSKYFHTFSCLNIFHDLFFIFILNFFCIFFFIGILGVFSYACSIFSFAFLIFNVYFKIAYQLYFIHIA